MSSEVVLQEAPQREARTILGLLTEQMEGVESGGNRRRRTLKERFGFMGCCGAAWANAFRSHHREQPQRQMDPDPDPDPDPGAGMNLAAALAAERQLRGPAEEEGEAPWRVSLMRLLDEEKGGGGGGLELGGNDSVCCVCMGRKKGAAFIPCGHTFCRVCSRELWLNRGSCPLCNRSILQILDIF